MVTVEDQLAAIGVSATSRVKTRSVLIEKLQREQGMALARVQDMAGARIVIEGGCVEQDAVVQQLVEHFDAWSSTTKPSKIVDRREKPSHGYRAVHVIVFPESVPVEIQVRTELQNYWAQIVERLADRWGRGVRYGDDPKDPQIPAEGITRRDGSAVTRQGIIDDLRHIFAEQIAGIEKAERAVRELKNETSVALETRIAALLGREVVDLASDALQYYPRMRLDFKRAVTIARGPRRPSVRRRMGMSSLVRGRRQAGRLIRRTVPNVTPPSIEFVRQKHRQCEAFVDDMVEEQRPRLLRRQARLQARLQGLGQYIEQGGIR